MNFYYLHVGTSPAKTTSVKPSNREPVNGDAVPSFTVLTERYDNHLDNHRFLQGRASSAILPEKKDEFFRIARHEIHKEINKHRSPEMISSIHHSLNPFLPSLAPSAAEHARDIKFAVLLHEQLSALKELEDLINSIEPTAVENGEEFYYRHGMWDRLIQHDILDNDPTATIGGFILAGSGPKTWYTVGAGPTAVNISDYVHITDEGDYQMLVESGDEGVIVTMAGGVLTVNDTTYGYGGHIYVPTSVLNQQFRINWREFHTSSKLVNIELSEGTIEPELTPGEPIPTHPKLTVRGSNNPNVTVTPESEYATYVVDNSSPNQILITITSEDGSSESVYTLLLGR